MLIVTSSLLTLIRRQAGLAAGADVGVIRNGQCLNPVAGSFPDQCNALLLYLFLPKYNGLCIS
jgi:hypothetical protein